MGIGPKKVCRIWIFNIGRGFASAIKTPGGHWITIDLGASEEFNPVADFLTPRFEEVGLEKNGNDKFKIAQTIISHPHDDHLTSIKEFDENIYPNLLTVPNDVDDEGQPEGGKVNWELVNNQSDKLTKYLKKMFSGRTPPLRATTHDETNKFKFNIFYLLPETCESDDDLSVSNYANNISIITHLDYCGNTVLFCGDMMKDGMKKILEDNDTLYNLLSNGIDYLIAPHHGLRSSFSTDLFAAMKDGKTRCLNIISERPIKEDSNEIVDSRYGSKDYCAGKNNLPKKSDGTPVRKLKTSAAGHILISLYDTGACSVESGDSCLN